MSYCRWDTGDLYIYADVDGGFTCCGCRLGSDDRIGKDGDWEFFNTPTRAGMVEHIKQHEAAGHKVQSWVRRYLEAEIAAGIVDDEVTS